ncbi:MAG: hypothetical protein ABF289_17725, partial [Clostridiales bacterium]
ELKELNQNLKINNKQNEIILNYNDEYLENKFKTLIEKENISGVISISNCEIAEDSLESIISNAELSRFKVLYLFFNYLKLYSKSKNPIIYSIIRLNGKFGINRKKTYSVIPASLGFSVNNMSYSWENVCVKSLDIDSGISDEKTISLIRDEFFSIGKNNSFIGVTNKNERFKLKFSRINKNTNYKNKIEEPNHRTVFFVTGDLFENSFEFIKKVSIDYKSNFIIAGDIKLIEREPKWAKNLIEPSQLKFSALNYYRSKYINIEYSEINKKVSDILITRKIKNNIESIKRQGSSIIYLNVDINDYSQVKSFIKYGEEQIGKVNGIFYSLENGKKYKDEIKNRLSKELDKNILGMKNIIKNIDNKLLEYIYFINFINKREEYIFINTVFEKIICSLSLYYSSLNAVAITCDMYDESKKDDLNIFNNNDNFQTLNCVEIFSDILKGEYGNYQNYILRRS